MKLAILDGTGKKVGDFDLQISDSVRDDIFKKAFISENSYMKQSKGSDPLAGKKYAINLSKRRKHLRTTYGRGGSRTPKKVMWGRGTQFRMVGAFAPNTVGGRKAHPPKASKIIIKNINYKEWVKALRIGLIASFDKKLVQNNGQKIPESYPFVLSNDFEKVAKTKDVKVSLDKLGFVDEIERTAIKKIKAGRGKMRNRKYKVKRGPLLVVSSIESPVRLSARNIQGFEVLTPEALIVSDFGMSEKPGRVVLFTENALKEFLEVMK